MKIFAALSVSSLKAAESAAESGWEQLQRFFFCCCCCSSSSSDMFQMSVKLHERLQTPKHCSSDTQIGDSDRGAVDSLSLCVPPTRHRQHRWGWCVQQQQTCSDFHNRTPSNLRPEHFLEVIILFDVRCLLFPPVSILSKRHPTTVMGFATLQLQSENKTLNALRVDRKSSKLAV